VIDCVVTCGTGFTWQRATCCSFAMPHMQHILLTLARWFHGSLLPGFYGWSTHIERRLFAGARLRIAAARARRRRCNNLALHCSCACRAALFRCRLADATPTNLPLRYVTSLSFYHRTTCAAGMIFCCNLDAGEWLYTAAVWF